MHLDDLEIARRNMVLQQIRPWDVFDERVLSAIQTIPREKFVPEAYLGLAFADIEVPIGHGQAMMAPRVEARMLQSLDVEHSVLEIGTGSGFVTACLARLGGQVISIDLYEEFIAAARKRLEAVGLGATTQLRTTDAFSESFDNQQFDRIAVTGSLPDYDKRFEQLLTHGGRLFVVIGQAPAMEATLVTRVDENAWHREGLFETELTSLEHAPQPEQFVF